MEENEETGESKARSIVIVSLYAIGIGLNVYLLVDQMTDGALSRELSLKWYHFKGNLKYSWLRRQELRKSEAKMIWDAIQIVEGKPDGSRS